MKKRFLALDTASPTVSLAAGNAKGEIAEHQLDLRQSSEQLFTAIDHVLAQAGLEFAELEGLVALRGPGSFTGLRVGLSAVLGFHQATGIAATALETLPILARTVDLPAGERIIAAVDALRGDWFTQSFRAGFQSIPQGEPGLCKAESLFEQGPCVVVGFGVEKLRELLPVSELAPVQLVEPPPLARLVLEETWRSEPEWDPGLLISPIYFRAPAVTLPKKPRL